MWRRQIAAWIGAGALALAATAAAQTSDEPAARAHHERPKLVVGIVIDQMRYDYLYRYWDQYGDGGFKRLLNDGFSFDNAYLDYAPPFTGPGHASVYTGTTPSGHGIIGNVWFVRERDERTYVVSDDDAEPVGTSSKAGKMSPHWLLASTLSDELILHSNGRSRAVAFSLKDRGAILAAGRLGDAYWFDPESGHAITSDHYMSELPDWVQAFNAQDLPSELLAEPWELLLPESEYGASISDDNPYEVKLSRTFPHDLPAMAKEQGNQALQYSPGGNSLTLAFARAALDGEQLGRDAHTDLLAISFSSTDYLGHAYAPASREVQDTYLRLDRELAQLLDHLDETIGLDEVLVFLTGDHGAAHNPTYVDDQGFPARYYDQAEIAERLEAWMAETYGESLLRSFSNDQVFLDHDQLRELGLDRADVEQDVIDYLLRHEDGVVGALGASTLSRTQFSRGIQRRVQNGFHQLRSGDVAVWFRPQWLPTFRNNTGTTHASVYNYDNRLPLIFYGWDIPAGRSAAHVGVADIAPTVSLIMNTPFPSATSGSPLQDLIYGRPTRSAD